VDREAGWLMDKVWGVFLLLGAILFAWQWWRNRGRK
jgi:hypothetical protein